jgi:large subunit ribosomal protein L21
VYAVVETGGKQYRVDVGQVIEVERLPANEGDQVELDRVLMVSGDDGVQVGTPVVEGAKVSAEVLGHTLDSKKVIFKFKPKERYRRKKGHRQELTQLEIKDIII